MHRKGQSEVCIRAIGGDSRAWTLGGGGHCIFKQDPTVLGPTAPALSPGRPALMRPPPLDWSPGGWEARHGAGPSPPCRPSTVPARQASFPAKVTYLRHDHTLPASQPLFGKPTPVGLGAGRGCLLRDEAWAQVWGEPMGEGPAECCL